MIVGCVAAFIVLKSRYPVMFYYASLSGAVPDKPADDYTSWITLSEKKVHEDLGWGSLTYRRRSTESILVWTTPCCSSSPPCVTCATAVFGLEIESDRPKQHNH